MKLARLGLVVAALVIPATAGAGTDGGRVASSAAVARRFVAAANRGDYATVCRLYSRHYLKTSQAACRSLYRWGASVYGRFDYRIVRRRRLGSGHRRIDLTRWHHHSFIELARERPGWRIVAGGW
jgi:hypothetical protein